VELGYARVSTTTQDLERQRDALHGYGIRDALLWQDKKTGATVDRPGLAGLLAAAQSGDTIVATTLDRLGRNLRDCLNLVHDLRERGVGIKTLRDPLPIDTSDDTPAAQIAVAMLSLFSEIERVFALERAAHARAVRERAGAPVGRPKRLDADSLAAARAAVEGGMSVREVARVHGVGKSTLYRALNVGGNGDTGQEGGE